MKLPPITGIIDRVTPVRDQKRGFSQTVYLTTPEKKNDQGYVLSKAQYYVIQTWSNKKDDSRFIDPAAVIGHTVEANATVYLDAQRWQGRNGLEYNHRLNLDKWLSDEELAAINLKQKPQTAKA